MQSRMVLSIALAASALACTGNRTSESTGEVVPLGDTISVPTDTITTRSRDDTLNMQRDTTMGRDTTSVFRDTTARVYGDTTTRSVRDTAAASRNDSALTPAD